MWSLKLKRFYRRANRAYFGGKLPSKTIIQWDPELHRREKCIGIMEYFPGRIIEISLDPWLKRSWSIVAMTLLHEMAHIKLLMADPYGSRVGHGPKFQREMRRLSRVGAFDGLW